MMAFIKMAWTAIRGLFTGSSSSIFIWILVGIIALVVIPSVTPVMEFFGYKSRATLIKELEAERAKTHTATEANKSLIDAANIEKESGKAAVESVESYYNKTKKSREHIDGILERLDAELAQIRKEEEAERLKELESQAAEEEAVQEETPKKPVPKPAAPKTPTATQPSKEAVVQIDAIWETYCGIRRGPNCQGGK